MRSKYASGRPEKTGEPPRDGVAARRRAGTGEAGRDGGARRRDAIAAGESAHRQRLLQ
ncbi:hypothetical protein BURPS1710b_A1232 [Burkholderia pseudomallei 1710b]|uniref:Uncharacterized protein n=1 Tax=Burkholderia pseudomallei (strain 1710b) TaxID=320372 RepID=Q3JJ64_BURP1|nr:hypothetical protein BURPS1710b_A1232 [Burkholderia pseudomallei 1710b]